MTKTLDNVVNAVLGLEEHVKTAFLSKDYLTFLLYVASKNGNRMTYPEALKYLERKTNFAQISKISIISYSKTTGILNHDPQKNTYSLAEYNGKTYIDILKPHIEKKNGQTKN
ncbi:MAG: hypothetical protein WC755_07160 [Candidatus Woesearchaeota archaeon]|jgi:DNA phosphorothioation-dependent restriction protein DptG